MVSSSARSGQHAWGRTWWGPGCALLRLAPPLSPLSCQGRPPEELRAAAMATAPANAKRSIQSIGFPNATNPVSLFFSRTNMQRHSPARVPENPTEWASNNLDRVALFHREKAQRASKSSAAAMGRGSRPASTSTGGEKKGEERVLSHGDVVLIRSDLAILRGPRFINDRIIAFYFAHLSAGLGDDLLLLPPSIPYLLSNLPDPASVAAVAEPLRLASRRLVLLPVNDNPDASVPEGGAHWTLLVLDNNTSPSGPRFVHHDSIRGAPNLPVASHLADALRPLLLQSDSRRRGVVPVVEGPTPRQPNGYDCGVYVMAIARAICGWWKSGHGGHRGGDWFEAVRSEVDADSVKAMRGELLQLITTLIQDKANASSTSEGNKTSNTD